MGNYKFKKSIKIANPELNEHIKELVKDANKIIEVKVTYIPNDINTASSKNTLKEIIPIDWSDEVLSGKKQAKVTKG